ncbi:helix-turn-helix transcriptional regulator [Zoogloea sp. G-4-1-14]|uniref:Helix-turn-helix transcriptional regulator n=1 Tax=Zoogloea dura TaxID=2728840 RepID=A0A848GDF6_9RHOO|nr:helix-turn-helix transcriptional regulator [Zoogloea dura]
MSCDTTPTWALSGGNNRATALFLNASPYRAISHPCRPQVQHHREATTILTRGAPKELSVARLFGEGLTYKAVARRLGLSPATVRHHLRQAYSKLHIQNKGEIAWLLTHAEAAMAQ